MKVKKLDYIIEIGFVLFIMAAFFIFLTVAFSIIVITLELAFHLLGISLCPNSLLDNAFASSFLLAGLN